MVCKSSRARPPAAICGCESIGGRTSSTRLPGWRDGMIMPASDMATRSKRARSIGIIVVASYFTVPSRLSMKRCSLGSAVMSCSRCRRSGDGIR